MSLHPAGARALDEVMLCPALSELGFGDEVGAFQVASPGTAVAVANRAYYQPFYLPTTVQVLKLYIANGATIDGNIDMGIYSTAGTRLVSQGSVAHAGVDVLQPLDIADTVLARGTYYLSFAASSATATFTRIVLNTQICRAAGLLQQNTAFPLPATATFATYGSSFVPLCGLSLRTLVA